MDLLKGIAVVTVAQDTPVGVGKVDGAIPGIDGQRTAQNPTGPAAMLSIRVKRAEILQFSRLQVITKEIAGRPGQTVKPAALGIHSH